MNEHKQKNCAKHFAERAGGGRREEKYGKKHFKFASLRWFALKNTF